jgi:hypothetical protein
MRLLVLFSILQNNPRPIFCKNAMHGETERNIHQHIGSLMFEFVCNPFHYSKLPQPRSRKKSGSYLQVVNEKDASQIRPSLSFRTRAFPVLNLGGFIHDSRNNKQ